MNHSNKNKKHGTHHSRTVHNTLKMMALALIATLAFGCSKDDDGGDPTPTEQLRLKTYTKGSTETNFSYNSDNRLSSWITGSTTSNVLYDSENRPTQVGYWSYSYNALGRITGMVWTANPADYYANFVYNNEGLVVTSNFRFGSNYATRTFAYNASNQLLEMIEEKVGGSAIDKFLLSYDGKGNISQVKRQRSTDGGTTYTDQFTYTYTYDDQKNPGYELLKSLGITSHLSFVELLPIDDLYNIIGNLVYFQPLFYSPNNVLTSSYYGSGTTTYSYEYVYNESGFPTSVEITRNDGTVTYQNWIYETVPE